MYHSLSSLTHHQFSHYERFFGCVLKRKLSQGKFRLLKLRNSAQRYSGHSREMQNHALFTTWSANFQHSSALCGFTLRCSPLGQCNRSFIQYRRIGGFLSPQLFCFPSSLRTDSAENDQIEMGQRYVLKNKVNYEVIVKLTHAP